MIIPWHQCWILQKWNAVATHKNNRPVMPIILGLKLLFYILNRIYYKIFN
uniref:Uncharacterized protein n=1 Tax=Rhizophora mucronata TaxID=61149 RepID=A0A2P2P2I4_RHIMU